MNKSIIQLKILYDLRKQINEDKSNKIKTMKILDNMIDRLLQDIIKDDEEE